MLALFTLVSLTPDARANKYDPFECCHLPEPVEVAARPLTIRLEPVTDQRPPQASPEEAPLQAGIIRGGYANAFKLVGEQPVHELVHTALAQRLQSLGHTVVAQGDADVVISGAIADFEVDISSYGTFKKRGRLTLRLASGGRPTEIVLEVNDHVTSGARLGMAKGLKQQAKRWYGSRSIRSSSAAAVEMLLVDLASQLGDRSHGYDLLVSGTVDAAPAAPGCTMDTDCKGDRICEAGVCVSPPAQPAQP